MMIGPFKNAHTSRPEGFELTSTASMHACSFERSNEDHGKESIRRVVQPI